MASCITFSCYLKSLTKPKEETIKYVEMENDVNLALKMKHSDDNNNHSDIFEQNSTFRIIFPVMLVISVLVVIAIGFLLHRLITSVMRKNWPMSRSNSEEECNMGGRFRRREIDQMRTVCSYGDVPPTYNQVMQSIELEKQPPSYYQVMTGAVNCGYLTEDQSSESTTTSDAEKGNTNSLTHSRTQPKGDYKSSVETQRENNVTEDNENSRSSGVINQIHSISQSQATRNPQTGVNRRRDNSVIIAVADICITPTGETTVTETDSTVDTALRSSV